ncbi:RDD family protein [Dermatobacter hominis]|uniref:RDD family protein n=1 Tax=Dermatobacter hominis TaxID=2884263 RepID=UPI001D1090FC|nr:RDD family protein [Dermatobacter hominis]UDY37733.1 RDD family protein [Dermatobacter hominis]
MSFFRPENWGRASGPEPPLHRPEPDHGTVDLYVGDLQPPQLHHLDLLLTSADIPFFVGVGIRTVPAARAGEAEDLIDAASREDDPGAEGGTGSGPGDGPPASIDGAWLDDDPALLRDQPDAGAIALGSGASTSVRVLAGTGRRAWAQVVNWFGLGCLASVAVTPLLSDAVAVGRTVTFVLYLVLCIVLTGIWGKDLGQLVCRLQVVGADGLPPGLRRATRRVLVVYGPMAVLYAVEWALYLGDGGSTGAVGVVVGAVDVAVAVGWPVAILFSIAQDDDHQGWHDRVGGTWVVTTAPRRDRLGALRRSGPAIGAAAGLTVPTVTGPPDDDEPDLDDEPGLDDEPEPDDRVSG